MHERVETQILALSARTTSPNYLDGEHLVEFVDRDDRHVYAHLAGVPESGVTEIDSAADLDRTDCEVRGFALTGVYSLDEYESVVNVPVDRILRETPVEIDDFPLSQFKVAAVDPDHQGRGIGTALTATAMAELFASPPVIAMLWERDNPANVKLAEHYAENRLATFENYFGADWLCPDCGFDAECTCSVAMYGWFSDGRPARPTDGSAAAETGSVAARADSSTVRADSAAAPAADPAEAANE